MPAPTISSRSPAASATNVSLNEVITITFDTALLSTTVVPANFGLRHYGSNMQIKVAVSYDSATYTVTLIPEKLLWANSTFQVTVIGADSALGTGNLKASDNTDFATTTRWQFQTGTDIETTEDKTESVKEREGDLFLPSGLQVNTASQFQFVSSVPTNGSWGFTGESIVLTFNRQVNTGMIDDIVVYQRPFLDEAGWFAQLSSGSYTFEWENSTGSTWDLPTFTITSTGTTVTLTASTGLFYNTLVEVVIPSTLQDYTGNLIEEEVSVLFTTHSYPNYVTPRLIRNEIFSIFEDLNLEYVHQVVWKWMVNAFRVIGHRNNFGSKGAYIRDYVKYGSIMDIMQSLWLEKSLSAGVMKTLGDFIVEYHPSAGDLNKNGIYTAAKEKFDKAFRAIAPQTLRAFIKGWNAGNEPLNYRYRLWKNPRILYNNIGFSIPYDGPADNTAIQRDGKLPGAYNSWN